MDKVLFDSKSEKFKKPFGAVKSGEEICFFIYVHASLNPLKVYFVCRSDNNSKSIYRYMQKSGKYEDFDIFSCRIKIDLPNLYFYRFEAETLDGRIFIGLKDGTTQIGEWLSEWQLTVYSSNFKTPDWVKGKIMYQIFPDRFAKSKNYVPEKISPYRTIHENWSDIPEFIYDTPEYKANDFFCGNVLGVMEKLNYLKELGVSIIYFNPIFESPENHRYSTADYMKIDSYFGTNEQFKTLCEKCDELDIKIILDGVFSHTGADSIYFNKYGHYPCLGAYNSTASPYFDWYNFIEYPDKYESWWGFDNLPNVKETNPEYMKYITGDEGVVMYWQTMGAAGWRLDVADELPDEFLDSLYARSKKTAPDAFIVGEVWEDATNKFAYGKRRRYLLGGQMDSVMNYPWRTAILEFVKYGDEKLFNDRILTLLENYPPQVISVLMNIISTHDTVRAMTYLGVNHEVDDTDKGKYVLTPEEYKNGKAMLFLAVFLQFTLPGVPCIYYGDEVGLYGFRDPYCRKTFPYGKEDFEILSFYKKIAYVRLKNKEHFLKPFCLHKMDKGLYSFYRGDIICVLNTGHDKNFIEICDKNIIFSHGEITLEEDRIILEPKAMIILKKQH